MILVLALVFAGIEIVLVALFVCTLWGCAAEETPDPRVGEAEHAPESPPAPSWRKWRRPRQGATAPTPWA